MSFKPGMGQHTHKHRLVISLTRRVVPNFLFPMNFIKVSSLKSHYFQSRILWVMKLELELSWIEEEEEEAVGWLPSTQEMRECSLNSIELLFFHFVAFDVRSSCRDLLLSDWSARLRHVSTQLQRFSGGGGGATSNSWRQNEPLRPERARPTGAKKLNTLT